MLVGALGTHQDAAAQVLRDFCGLQGVKCAAQTSTVTGALGVMKISTYL